MPIEQALRSQNAALNEQIKLLVKTEQRLHRSQNEIDRQVTRIEWLSRFALTWTAGSSSADILSGAIGLLRKLFRIDALAIVSVRGALEGVTLAGARHPVPVAQVDTVPVALAELRTTLVEPWHTLPADLRGAIAVLGLADEVTPDDVIVILPLRDAHELPTLFLVTRSGAHGRMAHVRELPGPKSLTFLQLLSNHVEHMLRNTALLADLAATQARVVAARDQLEERVAARTAELRQEVAERCRAELDLIVARDAAYAASRAKSAFLANMSHELRTPLNAIIGYAELLAEEATASGADAAMHTDLARIVSSGRHLLRLVTDVLDLSKIEAGKMPVARDACDVSALVAAAVSAVMPLVTANANTLDVSPLDEVGCLFGDRVRVTQVLINLLGNAAKFTRSGRIHVDASRTRDAAGEHVVLHVTDTGIGMSPEVRRNIFLDFVQGDGSSTREHEGTGLGLAISLRLCRLMGGKIDVESEPGVGSRFTVTLPAAPSVDVLAAS